MFGTSFYMYFGPATEYSHSYLKNDAEYWLLSIYCESDDYCDYSFEITGKEESTSSSVWLVLGLIITVALLCFTIPLAVILIIRIRKRKAQVVGLQPGTLERQFPTKKWAELKHEESSSCAICLEDFSRQSTVRMLSCGHIFHCTCIDAWASTRAVCPLCKSDILPSTINNTFLTESTPALPARIENRNLYVEDIED